MTVYADKLMQHAPGRMDAETRRAGARGGHRWCHLFAAPADWPELVDIAERIGLRQTWVQLPRSSPPHYDLTPARRGKALEAGAVEAPHGIHLEVGRQWRELRGATLADPAFADVLRLVRADRRLLRYFGLVVPVDGVF